MPTPNPSELARGIHRLELERDNKLFGYHVLDGANGPIVVDPGFSDAPETVYDPFLTERGQSLADVSLAVITHADADHHGGTHALKQRSPGVTVAAHAADVDLMESVERIMDERYGKFAPEHGIAYDDETANELEGMMGPDEPIDLRLVGGEAIRVGERTLRVLHTPGHTRGHVMMYDEREDLLIGGDGFFARGVVGRDGATLQPPPYFLYPAYRNTIELVRALDPSLVSFTHYAVLRGEEITEFIEESLAFVDEMEALALDVLDEYGTITLHGAIEAVVERRGSFGLDLDLAYPLLAHYTDLTDRGVVEETTADAEPINDAEIEGLGVTAWQRA